MLKQKKARNITSNHSQQVYKPHTPPFVNHLHRNTQKQLEDEVEDQVDVAGNTEEKHVAM